MALHLKPDVAARLEALASAQGLSVDDYLIQLVERELPSTAAEAVPSEGSGMVWENGLLVYRTGKPLPADVVGGALRRSREKRARHIMGDLP
jgi:hypothetical protein